MATKKTSKTGSAAPAATPNRKNLTAAFDLANSTAQTELGDATNKSVTATVAVNVSSTEGTKTVNDGGKSTVALEVSHSETDTAAKK